MNGKVSPDEIIGLSIWLNSLVTKNNLNDTELNQVLAKVDEIIGIVKLKGGK
jgi:hypothetical protein